MSKGGGWRASTPRTLPIPSLGMWVSYLTEGTQDMKNNHMSDAQRAAYRKCDKIAEKALAKYGRASADAATEYVREATQGQRARAYERSQAATATECKDAATWQEDYVAIQVSANMDYERIVALALEKFKETDAAEWEEYKKVCAAAREKYLKS